MRLCLLKCKHISNVRGKPMDELSFKIKVMNYLTGEISEVEIDSASKAAETLKEFKASEKALKEAIKQINNRLMSFMGEQEQFELPNGMLLQKKHTQRSEWQMADLRKFLDADQLEIVTTVKKKDATTLLGELIEQGAINPGAIKILNENAMPTSHSVSLEIK